MIQRLAQVLREWKAHIAGKPNDFVFRPRSYRSAIARAKKLAGLSEDVVFHSLRRTYISRLVLAGVDIRTVQELAGHTSISMTMRCAHSAPEDKKRAVAGLGAEVTANLITAAFDGYAARAVNALA